MNLVMIIIEATLVVYNAGCQVALQGSGQSFVGWESGKSLLKNNVKDSHRCWLS